MLTLWLTLCGQQILHTGFGCAHNYYQTKDSRWIVFVKVFGKTKQILLAQYVWTLRWTSSTTSSVLSFWLLLYYLLNEITKMLYASFQSDIIFFPFFINIYIIVCFKVAILHVRCNLSWVKNRWQFSDIAQVFASVWSNEISFFTFQMLGKGVEKMTQCNIYHKIQSCLEKKFAKTLDISSAWN